MPISNDTSKHSNFPMAGGKSTGTYWFNTGFYALTTMPAEFQRVMDSILSEFPKGQAFINDNLVLSKGTEIEKIVFVGRKFENWIKRIRRLSSQNMILRSWNASGSGISTLVQKTDPIDNLQPPRTLLKSFMGSIHSLRGFDTFSNNCRRLQNRRRRYGCC